MGNFTEQRSSRFLVALVATASAIVALAPAAEARGWTRFASGGMNVSDQVGLARTSDGVLHVAWRHQAMTQELLHTPISRSGRVGPPVTAVSNWASIGSPALARAPFDTGNTGAGTNTLEAFFPGVASLTTGDSTYGLDLAESGDRGASWSVNYGRGAIARNDFAFARTPAAVINQRGYRVQAWYGTDSTVVHAGTDPNRPAMGGYGMGTDQALATARDNQVMVAWCTELAARTGVFLARVDFTTGARIGDVAALPDTGRCPADTRVALASFPDVPRKENDGEPYFYTAASSANGRSVRVFVLAEGRVVAVQKVAGGASFKQQIAIATGRHGRVWVGWRDSDTGALMFRRSDPRSGFVYGARVTKRLPAGQRISQLALDAQDDRLDVIATTSDDNNAVSLFATQVLPGLTLLAGTAGAIERKGFRVLDAGDPVRGATIRVARRSLTTDRRGYAKTRLPKGSFTAVASKPGYEDASVRVRNR